MEVLREKLTNIGLFSLVVFLFPYLLKLNFELSKIQDLSESLLNPSYLQFPENETYDYIIVGGGTAGSLLSKRLSKDSKHEILLLERGGDPDPLLDIPALAPILITNETDYGYYSQPQLDSFYATNNRVHLLRGKGLGGSGNLYYLQYHRGNKKCYDEWAQLSGDNIWAWDNVLKYFKRSEDYNGFYQPINRKFHGVGGEMSVTTPSFHPSSKYFYDALKEKGVNIQDINLGAQPAPLFTPVDINVKNGKRCGPFQAFTKPSLFRSNLKIYRFSQVTKVIFDKNHRAKGVQYMRHGVMRKVFASKEIILSAGSIDTPKILQLSGVGPKDLLNSLKIEVVKDLPVGNNLQDHVCTVINRFEFDREIAFVPPRDLTPQQFLNYFLEGKGPLSLTNVLFANGFSSSPTNYFPPIPDIQYFIAGTYLDNNVISKPLTGGGGVTKRSEIYKNGDRSEADANSVVLLLGRPLTTNGTVRIKSKNPEDNPLINHRFFSNPLDMPRLVSGFKFILDIYLNSSTYAQLGTKFNPITPAMCQNYDYLSDEWIECYIRFYTGVIHHSVGTCRMGKLSDPRSVVDSRLRVIGVKKLRVVDGSIMPKIINANTHAPIYMIAEVAADIILGKIK